MGFGLTLVVTLLMINIRLDMQIKKDGIYVRFFPFHLNFRFFSWEVISKSFVRQYNPIAEYGGWGFRLGLFGRGRALNISGDKGLQLEFSDGKKLLIGTIMPEELRETLIRLGQLKE